MASVLSPSWSCPPTSAALKTRVQGSVLLSSSYSRQGWAVHTCLSIYLSVCPCIYHLSSYESPVCHLFIVCPYLCTCLSNLSPIFLLPVLY